MNPEAFFPVTNVSTRFVSPGGGVTLRGSDGQLHPRAPPKPLRVSVVFPNAVLPSSYIAHDDPSSFYDELVVQVTCHSPFYCSCFGSLKRIGFQRTPSLRDASLSICLRFRFHFIKGEVLHILRVQGWVADWRSQSVSLSSRNQWNPFMPAY